MTFANSTPNESSGYAETSALAAAQQYYFKAIISILIAHIITRAAPSAIDRINAMYVDKLDGLIDTAFFEKMSNQWREEQYRCQREIDGQIGEK